MCKRASQHVAILYWKVCIGVKLCGVLGSMLPDLAMSQEFMSQENDQEQEQEV
jgi:hypothetical protein